MVKLGRGLRDWFIQRGSAIIIASYFIFLAFFWILNSPLDYFSWKHLFSHLGMQIFSTMFFISLGWHSWIGLWTIVTDYIKPPLLRFSILAFILCLISLMIISGSYIVWKS